MDTYNTFNILTENGGYLTFSKTQRFMSTASREKCCSIGVQIIALHEYKMQYTQARVTGALQVLL